MIHVFFFVICQFFSKSSFSKYSFWKTFKVSNSLDPDQARHFVGPDLGPSCLQRFKYFILGNDYDQTSLSHKLFPYFAQDLICTFIFIAFL